MSNPTELPDLDKLEALARAATPGPWAYQEDSDVYTHIVRPVQSPGNIVRHYAQDTSGVVEANARFTAGANPAAVLALIALARRAQPEGEAPQADLTRRQKENAEFAEWWASSGQQATHDLTTENAAHATWQERARRAATLSPLCGAQHAESGKEAQSAYEILLEVCRGGALALIELRSMVSDPEHVAFINRALANPQAFAAQLDGGQEGSAT
jgi:hypothetical protein